MRLRTWTSCKFHRTGAGTIDWLIDVGFLLLVSRVSTISFSGLSDEITIVRAAKAAGVKLFVPSEVTASGTCLSPRTLVLIDSLSCSTA